MITLQDIIEITDLTRDEVAAVAEHENLPELDAAALGDYLMHQHHGAAKLQQMICDDIRAALHKDDLPHARSLYAVLHHFLADHPEAQRGAPG